MDKAQILSAIKRIAAEDGGVPPGSQRFRSATGIAPSAWSGRYWARWGDALREAGFEANAWTQAFTEDEVLPRLIPYIRELGRFPTTRELELRRRADPDFPSMSVFRRLGNKSALAKKLIAYCGDDEKLADVRAICEPLVTDGRPGAEAVHTNDDVRGALGVVYMMKSGPHYKIGRSNHAGRRAYELAIQLPERLEIVHIIETDDPVGIERYWHERFGPHRANGEWFALTSADVAAFRRRKKFM